MQLQMNLGPDMTCSTCILSCHWQCALQTMAGQILSIALPPDQHQDTLLHIHRIRGTIQSLPSMLPAQGTPHPRNKADSQYSI